jgi:hypothetical protein
MDSLRSGIKNFTSQANNFVERLTGQEMSNTAALGATIVGGFALFVILSPGVLLNLPPITKGRCKKLVPFPTGATGQCNADGTYNDGAGDLTNFSGADQTKMDPICEARKKCESVGISGYTSLASVFVHAVVFTGILYVLLPSNKPKLL